MATAAFRPRSIDVGFEDLPRWWFGGDPVRTHLANGVNLLFPLGERFFVRSVRRYADRIDDPALAELVRAFSGQEAQHARAHERCFLALEAQGYDIRTFLDRYERIAYGLVEPACPPIVSLATTAALEHFTAVMAENILREPLLEPAHPSMRRLLEWHAAEEIEHRSVAFDVLMAVDPRYSVRMAGLASAALCLGGFWLMATAALLRQERGLSWGDTLRRARGVQRTYPIGRRVFLRGIRAYVRRDFHPSEADTDALAQAFLASVGAA